MAIFYNQATLSFNGRLTNSNVTAGEIVGLENAAKTAISNGYAENSGVVYVISLTNPGALAYTDLTVTDDLGGYTIGDSTVYPLEYVDGSVKLYVNGTLSAAPAATSGPPLVFSGITVPAGGNIMIVYEARANEFAPLATDGSITNTAVISAPGLADSITVTETVNAGEFTDLTIAKAITPETVSDNGEITYTFIIQNTGNTPAVATDDVIVTDTFTPILNPISVTYNGEEWTEGTNYTYSETTGEFATLPGQITVPAATYQQNPETGIITLTPGVAVITVTGNV